MGVFMHNIMHNILATVVVQTFCYFLSREAPRVSRPPGPDAPGHYRLNNNNNNNESSLETEAGSRWPITQQQQQQQQ